MKFYSEITHDLYDTVDALKAAEQAIEEEEKAAKIFALADKIVDAQLVCCEIATEIAKITGKDYVIPEIIVSPEGNLTVGNETFIADEEDEDGGDPIVTNNFPKHPSPSKEFTITCNNPIVDDTLLKEFFGLDFSKGKTEVKEPIKVIEKPIKVIEKPNSTIINGKKLSDDEVLDMLDILRSL
jgi:hypothetical protein